MLKTVQESSYIAHAGSIQIVLDLFDYSVQTVQQVHAKKDLRDLTRSELRNIVTSVPFDCSFDLILLEALLVGKTHRSNASTALSSR